MTDEEKKALVKNKSILISKLMEQVWKNEIENLLDTDCSPQQLIEIIGRICFNVTGMISHALWYKQFCFFIHPFHPFSDKEIFKKIQDYYLASIEAAQKNIFEAIQEDISKITDSSTFF